MAAEQPAVQWRTSSFTGNNGICVQLAALPDHRVAIRHSKAHPAGTLVFTRAEMRAWVRGTQAGEFDDLT